jgi:hypothetical protein
MPKDVILTPEGLEKLQSELDYLSTEKRKEVAERIKEAREFGDIAENSEYDDAKNEQAMLESRIAVVAEKLRMATVIEAEGLSTEDRQVGALHDRRLRRGQAGGEQALQRVAGRPRAARPQAQRDRFRAGPARAGAQAQDHQDRRRPEVGSIDPAFAGIDAAQVASPP